MCIEHEAVRAVDPGRILIIYYRMLEDLDADELRAAQSALGETADGPFEQVRHAMLLGHPRAPTDPSRAHALLQSVLASQDDEARELRALAVLLSNELLARERLRSQNQRVGARLAASERERLQLQQKLDAVTEIERSLPSRPDPDAALPDPPAAPTNPAPRSTPQ